MENNKIIVVGAGHGGLVAAAVLAKNGYNVTVYERNTKKQLGYDWRDCASLKVIREVGIDSLSESDFQIMPRTSFYLASCISPIVQSQENAKTNSTTVERRALLSALVDHAKECGAKIKFGVSVTEPIIDGDRVSGVVTDKGEVLCDLVIDAAGVDSPIRTALPEDFGIELNHAPGEVLYAYRGYFNKEEKYPETRSPYEVFIYQMGKKGLSWCVTEEDYVDMLIGSFSPIDSDFVEEMLTSFRIRRPQLGKKLLRGGEINKIPTRRPLSQMVCNGYAAVGDSAFMTEPMTGSGINLSLRAGKLLAEAVIEAEGKPLTVEALWSYNREYILKHGGGQVTMDILKNTMLSLKTEELDFLLEKKIISESDMTSAGAETNAGDLLGKLARGFRQLPSLIKIASSLSKGDAAKKIYGLIPYDYDKEAVDTWKQQVASTVVPLIPN